MCSPNIYAYRGVFNTNIPIFQPNCADGLHFGDFVDMRTTEVGICAVTSERKDMMRTKKVSICAVTSGRSVFS